MINRCHVKTMSTDGYCKYLRSKIGRKSSHFRIRDVIERYKMRLVNCLLYVASFTDNHLVVFIAFFDDDVWAGTISWRDLMNSISAMELGETGPWLPAQNSSSPIVSIPSKRIACCFAFRAAKE